MNAYTTALPRPFVARIADGFRGAIDILAEASTGMACAREAERLFALSDKELALRGLTRDQIIPHAFARLLAN